MANVKQTADVLARGLAASTRGALNGSASRIPMAFLMFGQSVTHGLVGTPVFTGSIASNVLGH